MLADTRISGMSCVHVPAEPYVLSIDAKQVADALPYDRLIAALEAAFAGQYEVPQRAHHEVPLPGGNPGTLLLMPAWRPGGCMGVKIATIFPDNAERQLPAVFASYLLLDGDTGAPLAILDGTEITLRRTAAASALASSYLSRTRAGSLLMVGTGGLAPHMIAAHVTVRPITEVAIWGRRREAASDIAAGFATAGFSVSVCTNLEEGVSRADIISCATLAREPLIPGDWLRSGQHLDLVGAYNPKMREADSRAMARAEVYVDTRAGALAEAGDIVQAIADGSISAADIRGDLRDLVTGKSDGRSSDGAITVFKSVGTAIEDLAAAELVLRNRG